MMINVDSVVSQKRERDFAIDVVKFLAVLLIINSHADRMYPHMKILATGGAIGDCLFLFCSGFTLFWGGQKSFGSYYKRRISRIYPSVFASVAFIHIVRQSGDIGWTELFCTKPFIMAIMVYYVLLYFIKKYAIDKVNLILYAVGVISFIVYIFWFPYKYEVSNKGLYGITTYYRWVPYFGAMLLGAMMGVKRNELKYHAWRDFLMFSLCLAIFYTIQFAAKIYRPVAPWQVVTILPLMGIVFYLYKWCNNDWLKRLYQNKWGNAIVMIVGGLCLESYLIQGVLFTKNMNDIWPLNLIVIVVVILVCSYIVRCVARLFAQTFRSEDYEWDKIFSLK